MLPPCSIISGKPHDFGQEDHEVLDLSISSDDDATLPVTIYKIMCIETGRSYVGQTEDLEARIKSHAQKPPSKMGKDLHAWGTVEGGAGTKLQWFSRQVKVSVLGRAARGARACAKEKAEIANHVPGYNIVLGGAPSRTKQGNAIIASRKKVWAKKRH